MIELVYETHSTSTDNEQGFATGWLPGELSERGREQARGLGRRRRDDGIDVVFSSDLRRAVQTAELAFRGSEMPLHQDARLRECNYGDLNGASTAEVTIAHSANRWAIQHHLHGTPLADVIEAPFDWQPGWEYVLDQRAATIL